MDIGIFLSSEEHGPNELVRFAQESEQAGFESVFVSDHFHPWIDAQGESPFVWAVIGGIAATTQLSVMTGVTCPIIRVHPVVVAQAAATAQLMTEGRFVLGVGTGEALNEHILGDRWPRAAERMRMLEEAVTVMRRLFTGDLISFEGEFYRVDNARLYSCPELAPPVYVSAFGPTAAALAGRIGDGLVTSAPAEEIQQAFAGEHPIASGAGSGRRPIVGMTKFCWGDDRHKALALAHELWPTEALPGQLNQELPTPMLFEQAASLVTEEQVAELIPCGPDPQAYVEKIQSYADAGFDQLYINQIGSDLNGFLRFFDAEVRPQLRL